MSPSGAPLPPPRKKTSGLTILLVFVGSAFLLGLAGIAALVLVVWHNPEGRRFFGVVGETVRVMQKAQKAPGTKELRSFGCSQAMVLEVEDFMRITSRIDAGEMPRPPFGALVVCAARPWGTPPGCDDVATTYITAVGLREEPFVVSVSQSGRNKPVCQGLYDVTGRRMRDFEDDVQIAPPPEEP
jgi:hypothetical protein